MGACKVQQLEDEKAELHRQIGSLQSQLERQKRLSRDSSMLMGSHHHGSFGNMSDCMVPASTPNSTFPPTHSRSSSVSQSVATAVAVGDCVAHARSNSMTISAAPV